MSVPGCYPCAQEQQLAEATDAERIWVGEHWRVAHRIRCAHRAGRCWVPRRHTTAVSQHSAEEVAGLGLLPVAASAAVEQLTGCRKTYVAQFAKRRATPKPIST